MFYRHNFISKFGIRLLLSLIPVLAPGSTQAQSWTKIGTFDSYLSFVKFLDANTGFVGTGVSSGRGLTGPVEIDKTTDGGKTWIKATIPSGYGGEIGDIVMVDQLNGWCAMTIDAHSAGYIGGTSTKALWRTTDGGLTWNETSLDGAGTSVRITPSAMVVTDILGNGHISTDGGATFSDAPFHSTNCVDFADPLHGVISEYRGQNWLYSNDGGLTWQTSGMTYESWSVYADSGTSNFFAAPEGGGGYIYHSTDYGETWGKLANFPFTFTGHLAGIGDKYLFCQVCWGNNTIGNVTYDGFYYSTDQGKSWTSIGGPPALNDTRFSVLDECAGITVYGIDSAANGSVYKYSFGTGSGSYELSLPAISQITQPSCIPLDTIIPIGIIGCTKDSFSLDSVWLQGSSAFAIVDSRKAPRTLSTIDSIAVQFSSTTSGKDTAQLNIRYNLGSGLHDTNITIIGSLNSTLLSSAPVHLHREVGSSYFGSQDSLPLGIDINSSVNIDSLWPYLHDISGTYTFDSSIVGFAAYWPPSGWTLTSIFNHGNAVDFGIHNLSSKSPSQPMDLGTAVFMPTYSKLATSDVSLANLVLDIGNQSIAPCVTEEEDQHWSVKVLVTDGVSEAENVMLENSLAIYPNPAGDELFVQNTNELPVSITLYDAIGRTVLTANATGASTTPLEMQELPSGSYMLVGHIGDNVITKRVSKIR